MSVWLRASGCSLCLVAMVILNGGHWLALQSFAWGRMLVEFSKQDSILTAVSKTFDGRHPCALCLEVRAGLQRQRQADPRALSSGPERISELVWDISPIAVPPAPDLDVFISGRLSRCYNSFVGSPPKPPPRVFSPAC